MCSNAYHSSRLTFFRRSPRQRLDTQPRAYEPKPRKEAVEAPGSKQIIPQVSIGLEAAPFKLQGFLLLSNTRNRCYANAALQCLHWISSDLRVLFRDAVTVGQLVHVTPEHNTLSRLTVGWHFDGGQHDAAEFLLRVFQNITTTFGCVAEGKSPTEAADGLARGGLRV